MKLFERIWLFKQIFGNPRHVTYGMIPRANTPSKHIVLGN